MSLLKILKKILPWIVYALVAVFIFLTLRDNFEQVKHYSIPRPWLLVPAILVFSAQFMMNSFIWARLMKYSRELISIRDSVYVYTSTFIVRYIPGNVWAIAARATMNHEYGVKVMKSIWGWVIENVSYLLVGLFFSIFILLSIDEVPTWTVAIVVVAIPACSLFLFKYEWLDMLVSTVAKKRFPEQVKKEVASLDLSMKQRLSVVMMFVVSWLLFSVQFFLITKSIVDVSVGSFFVFAGVNALAWTIGYVTIVTPSGTGVREGVMIVALMALGVDSLDALVIAILARMTIVLGEVLYFLIIKSLYAVTGGTRKKVKKAKAG